MVKTSASEISQRKLDANRRNAQKSTGPRTAEGKARSSRNATTHGIFCGDVVLPGENRQAFDVIRRSFIDSLKPQDFLELSIVDRLVTATWKLRRLQSAEKAMFAARELELKEYLVEEEDRDEDEVQGSLPAAVVLGSLLVDEQRQIERFSMIEQRLERTISRCQRELRQLRRDRGESHCDLLESPFAEEPADDAENEIEQIEATEDASADKAESHTPSPCNQREGGGEGSPRPCCKMHPLPNPLPEYRAREQEMCTFLSRG